MSVRYGNGKSWAALGFDKGSAVVQDKLQDGSNTSSRPEPNEGMNRGIHNSSKVAPP
jgi:hypothetical protein